MSFIEGIGDEVTLFFVIVIAFVLAALVTLINSRPSLHTIRTRIQSPSDRQTIILTPEIYTASIVHRRQNENQSLAQPQSLDDLINTNNNANDRHSDNDGINNPSEEQIVDDGATRTVENIRSNGDTRTNIIENTSTSDNTVTEDAQELNSEESPLEERGANASAENIQTEPGEIRVRLKYLDDTEKTVVTTPTTKIGDFKKKHFSEDIRCNKVVRLIFAGHLLQNTSTIENCRIVDNSVVHVQILVAPTPLSTPAPSQDTDLNLGRFLWPLITLILGLCWMTYFKYPEYYNSLSLGMLLLFSGCFFYFLSQTNH